MREYIPNYGVFIMRECIVGNLDDYLRIARNTVVCNQSRVEKDGSFISI